MDTVNTSDAGPIATNDGSHDLWLQRTASTTSATSTSSRRDKSRTIRPKRPSRQTSSILTTPTSAALEDNSLTSFPVLPPEDSPPDSRKEISGEEVVGTENNGIENGQDARHTQEQKDIWQAKENLAKIAAADALKTPTAKKPDLKPKRSMVAALTARTSTAQGRHSLFEDSQTPAIQDIPGALHYASEGHIERLIARIGAVKLVRQLAQDLASREAEMSLLRQRTELRERELKKMLREVEVGTMDIEARLHALDHDPQTGGKTNSGKRSSIGDLMDEAIGDDVSQDEAIFTSPESRDEQDRQATIRARVIRDADDASVLSQDTTASKPASRGWKDYLWSGTATKKSSRTHSLASTDEHPTARRDVSGPRRKGLDDSLFQPPGGSGSTQSKSRAASATSWTTKLFAGTLNSNRESSNPQTVRGRSNTTSNPATNKTTGSRTVSQASARTYESTKSNRRMDNRPSKIAISAVNFNKNGPTKGSTVTSPTVESPALNLGPVEMDAILPHGSRPPTLTPSYYNINNTDDLLTDRFGFIYDQRRRKKEAETLARAQIMKNQPMKGSLAASVNRVDSESLDGNRSIGPDSPIGEEAEPTIKKNWHDYLSKPTRPTELLLHAPSSSIITLSNPAIRQSLRRTSTFENIRENEPSSTPNPLPSTFTITASNAEIASPLVAVPETPITPAKTEFEPVKALLSQLTELHDKLQQEKTIKWNEFLRKVRVERTREKESTAAEGKNKITSMPEASLADGETIGIATLGNKGKVGRAKYREFKNLVLAGIPVSLRAKVWAECSGASGLRIPGYYSDLVVQGDDDPAIIAQIQMDINRTLTDNVFFRRGPGVEKLNEVLLAYSRRNVEVGYCQGMNLITASLLLIMPTAEDAFWMLVSIVENILPRHYFDNSLLTSRADQQVLKQYVTELLPKLAAHLDDLSIDLEALTFQWFLSLFTACLNAEALYRVWDVLLCCKDEEGNGGSTFLFQVALALLKLNEPQLTALDSPGEVYAYLGGEITNHAISIDGLIRASEGLRNFVRRNEVEERRERHVLREKEVMKEREAIERTSNGKISKGLEMQDPQPIED